MRTIAWLLVGFALLALKTHIQDAAAASGAGPSLNLLPIIVMLAASTCFYRALRSALAMIVNRGAPAAAAGGTPRPATKSRAVPTEDEFDADAAFERYMQRRDTLLDELPAEPAPKPVTPPAAPAFGRRVL